MPDFISPWKIAVGAVSLCITAFGVVWRMFVHAFDRADAARREAEKVEQRVQDHIDRRLREEEERRREEMRELRDALKNTATRADIQQLSDRLSQSVEELHASIRSQNDRIDRAHHASRG